MDSAMFEQELLHLFAPVDRPTVPQQKDRTPQVLEQLFEKGSNVQSIKIATLKSYIEGQVSALGRHCKGTDGRDSILFVEVIKNRSFAPGGPGPGHVRNQQEPRFIEKDQMGPKSLRFFLNAASGSASSVRSLPPSAARRVAQASDSSTPSPPITSTHDWDDRWHQSVFGSPRQSVSRSKGPFGTLRPVDLPAAPPPAAPCPLKTVWEDALESAWNVGPWTLTVDMLAAIGRPSSWRLPLDAPPPTSWHLPASTMRWHVAVAFPIRFGFHGVSCPPL
jgi:hypothetical protein